MPPITQHLGRNDILEFIIIEKFTSGTFGGDSDTEQAEYVLSLCYDLFTLLDFAGFTLHGDRFRF